MFRFRTWVALVVLGLGSHRAFAQSPYGWQVGTSAGTQRFTNNVDAQLGLGLYASVGRWLIPRLGANIAIDYSALPFQQIVTAEGVSLLNAREANLFGLDVLFDYSMATAAIVNPYLKVGGGLEGIKVGNSRRQMYVAGIAGAGVRIKIQPQIALHLHGDYHVLESQVLAGFAPDRPPNGYFTARAGLTFFTRKEESQNGGIESELVNVEQVGAEQNPTDEFGFEDEFESRAENSPTTNPGDAQSAGEYVSPFAGNDAMAASGSGNTGVDLSALEERLSQLDSEYGDPEPGLGERQQDEGQYETARGDLSALEARLQQLEQEYPDTPAVATGSSDSESLARESLETRLQQLDQEYPDAPAPATGASEGESLARESLETRLQQLEQEYPDTPAAATGASEGESLARENAPAADSSAFEERLDVLANQYENPPAPANQNADSFVELEEEPTEELTPFERTLRMLESEADETRRTQDYLNLNADAAPDAANGSRPLSNGTMATASPFAQGYEGALYDFYSGRYAEAVDGMSRLIDAYPNHILASNCYYWKGEAHLQANNLQEAIAAFTRVLEFEKSLKKDNALLMLGKAYMFLKRSDEARTAFNRVIVEYPTSEAVYAAQEYLRNL